MQSWCFMLFLNQTLHIRKEIAAVILLLLFPTPSYAVDVTLAWDASPAKKLAGYKVYYKRRIPGPPYLGRDANEGNSPIKIGVVNTFTLTGLNDYKRYFFVVTAYNFSGRESTYSNEVCLNCDSYAKGYKKSEEITKTTEVSVDLSVIAPVTLPSGTVMNLSRGQVEAIKKQPGVFYGTEVADMLGPGEVVVGLPNELGGGYIYGKPAHLAQAFSAVGATKGNSAAEHLFKKRRSCLWF